MKRGLVVALVGILLLAGLPVLVSMGGMTMCAECDLALVGAGLCLGVLVAAAGVALLMLFGRMRLRHARARAWLFAFALERPPQLV